METLEMAYQFGSFTESGMSPTTVMQGFDQWAGYLASSAAEQRLWVQVPEPWENSVDSHSIQLEDPVGDYAGQPHFDPATNSGWIDWQSSLTETEAMLKLPRYISESLYVADLHPLATENVGYLMDLFSRVGNVSVVKVIPKPPGIPGIPHCSAYVSFLDVEDACRAWQTLNYQMWMGQPMRIMFSNLDPATRYNEDANIIITDLEESIDSKFLHQMFSKYGAVVSSKVEIDPNGKSTGRAFIQFEDEIDAKLAIEVMNNEKVRGKKVYVGPFIRRKVHSEAADEVNKTPLDPNPALDPKAEVAIPSKDTKNESSPIGKGGSSRDTLLGSSSISGIRSPDLRFGTFDPAPGFRDSGSKKHHRSSSENTTSKAKTQPRHGGREAKERERNLRRGTKASRNLARRRFLIQREIQEMMKGKMSSRVSSEIPANLLNCLSSEPWPPQPWSVETLKDRLSKSHCPEERLAMLGATLFPLVARQTKALVSDVTNVLVMLDIVEIERIMNLSEEALQQKVEEVKEYISARVPAFVPSTFVDVPQAIPSVEEKHVILVEELGDLPPLVPAPASSPTPALTGPTSSANFKDSVVPNVPIPVGPEILQAPALPGFSLGFPLTPFPVVPLSLPGCLLPPIPLIQPCFPDWVRNYKGYRPRPGTGFYEPRVSHHLEGLYCIASAFAHNFSVQMERAIGAEESCDAMEELSHDERAQDLEESGELMEVFAQYVRLTQIVEESAEEIEAISQEECDQALGESVELMVECNPVRIAQMGEDLDEEMEEFAQEERAQAVKESFECMVECPQEESAQNEEKSIELTVESEHVRLAEIVEESAEEMEESAQEERAQAVEESGDLMEAFAEVERVQAVEELADPMLELALKERAQAAEKFAQLTEKLAPEESAELKKEFAQDEGARAVKEFSPEERAQAVPESVELLHAFTEVGRAEVVEKPAE